MTIAITGSLGEHRLAWDLVERGHAERATVSLDGHTSFEAWRISPTTYAWRTPAMAVPAFGPMVPDTRPDVYGMPRWRWDLSESVWTPA